MKVIVYYSGWMELGDDTKFFHLTEDKHITVKEYLNLDTEEQRECILESFGDAFNESIDGETEQLDISTQED